MTLCIRNVAQSGSQNFSSVSSHCSSWHSPPRHQRTRCIVCISYQVCSGRYSDESTQDIRLNVMVCMQIQPSSGLHCPLPVSAELEYGCADAGLTRDDLQVLEPSSVFVFILHFPNPIAAPFFALYSTQRLYLHHARHSSEEPITQRGEVGSAGSGFNFL